MTDIRNEKSIFEVYYTNVLFVDRYKVDGNRAVDVIIPIIHTNELWEVNLKSLYREIPVNRLLIGDGGCIDNSIEIVKKFPRVTVYDHSSYKSLGYSIRKLIESVETEWFVYPHSDVFFPDGWFDKMEKHQSGYDWFGCKMRQTVMLEYAYNDESRPYAGTQMGKRAAFIDGLRSIDDDYIYRQEDFVFSNLVNKAGYKEGKVDDTFHYHQIMVRKTKGLDLNIDKVTLEFGKKPEEEYRSSIMQIKGTIKYLDPKFFFARSIVNELIKLKKIGLLNWTEITGFIKLNNRKWLKYYMYWRIKVLLDGSRDRLAKL
ncbi:MAG: glycosyltransferase family A protein, partial [Proteobacteria bacterium]|nr:glycosyltransferase family A protein [Pseudomonadota bacterium]